MTDGKLKVGSQPPEMSIMRMAMTRGNDIATVETLLCYIYRTCYNQKVGLKWSSKKKETEKLKRKWKNYVALYIHTYIHTRIDDKLGNSPRIIAPSQKK